MMMVIQIFILSVIAVIIRDVMSVCVFYRDIYKRMHRSYEVFFSFLSPRVHKNFNIEMLQQKIDNNILCVSYTLYIQNIVQTQAQIGN